MEKMEDNFQRTRRVQYHLSTINYYQYHNERNIQHKR